MVAAFEEMLRGRAQVVSLTGEAGVGKSRLLQEWLATLEADRRLTSVTVRHAVCSSLGEQPYAVFAAFFREAYGVAPGDSLEVAREKLAAGLAALGGEGEETATIASLLGYVLGVEAADRFRHVEPEQLKRQIFLAMRRLIERRLRQGPLVLTVENLHWADAASVELLQVVLDRLADQPLMLVATCRPGAELRALATTRAAHTALRLMPLSPLESEALLAAYLGESTADMPPRLRQLVLARASGQPFYLEEILRGLIAAGVLVRGETRVDVRRRGRRPRTCRRPSTGSCSPGSTASRTGRGTLSRRRRSSGRCSTLALLREVASHPDGSARPRWSSSAWPTSWRTRRGRRTTARRARREIAATASRTRSSRRSRTRASCSAAGPSCTRGPARRWKAWSAGARARLEDIEALARHWDLGGDRRKAARYLVAAGDWARGLYANEDAIQHYERALAALAQCRGVRRARSRPFASASATFSTPLGRRAEALAHYEAVLAAAAAAGDRPAQARLRAQARDPLLGRGRSGGGGRPAPGRARAHGGPAGAHRAGAPLSRDGTAGVPERRQRGRGRLGGAGLCAGRAPGAAPAGSDAPARRERAAEVASAMAQAYNTLGVALARMGRLQDAVGHIERSLAVAEAHDLMQAACRGYTNLGVLYSTLDPKRAIDTCLRGLEMAKKIGDLGLQSRLNTNLAVAYCALTNRCEEQGLTAAQAALDLDRQLGQLDHLAVPLIVLGQIQQCHGDPELARGYYQEALALVEPTGEPQFLFPCYDGLATLYLDRDDHVRAEEFMQKAQQVCEQAGLDPESFVVLPFLE